MKFIKKINTGESLDVSELLDKRMEEMDREPMNLKTMETKVVVKTMEIMELKQQHWHQIKEENKTMETMTE